MVNTRDVAGDTSVECYGCRRRLPFVRARSVWSNEMGPSCGVPPSPIAMKEDSNLCSSIWTIAAAAPSRRGSVTARPPSLDFA